MSRVALPQAPQVRRLIRAGFTVVDWVVVAPIRRGRLRGARWPVGLKPIVTLALAAYGAALVLFLFAVPLRRLLPATLNGNVVNANDLPFGTAVAILALCAAALTLVQLGALHASVWLRWSVVVATAAVISRLVEHAATARLGVTISVAAAVAMLAAVTAFRGRMPFRWWEALLIGGPIFVVFIVGVAANASQSAIVGLDAASALAPLILDTVGLLAAPIAVAAGAEVGELSLSIGVGLVRAVDRQLGVLFSAGALAAVVLLRAWDIGGEWPALAASPARSWLALGLSAVLVVGVALLWRLWRRVDAARPRLSALSFGEAIGAAVLPIGALALIISGFPLLLVESPLQSFSAYGTTSVTTWLANAVDAMVRPAIADLLQLAIAMLLILTGYVLARRGRQTMPEVLAAVGAAYLVTSAARLVADLAEVPRVSALLVNDTLGIIAAVATVLLLACLLASRQLTRARCNALTAALIASTVFAHLSLAAEPLRILLGSSALAVVAVGIVWGQLTGYAPANADSLKYPRSSRVALQLGYGLLGVTVVAYNALTRDPVALSNMSDWESIGLNTLGRGLVVAALLVSLQAAVGARPGSRKPPGLPAEGLSSQVLWESSGSGT